MFWGPEGAMLSGVDSLPQVQRPAARNTIAARGRVRIDSLRGRWGTGLYHAVDLVAPHRLRRLRQRARAVSFAGLYRSYADCLRIPPRESLFGDERGITAPCTDPPCW